VPGDKVRGPEGDFIRSAEKRRVMPKTGKRPRRSPTVLAIVTRDNYLDIRLGQSEKQCFREAADIAGLPLSAWVRTRIRQVAARELQEAGRLIPLLNVP
jgi:hypothetical protein